MKILILGAGQVGGTLAEHLVTENDVTLVDNDLTRLRDLQRRLDLRTVKGPASQPEILREAGADDCEMLIAVTDSDEVNIVACQVGFSLFQIPTKIARIRSTSYLQHQELFVNEAMPIDVCICPEQLITDNVQHLIEYPGALQVLDFAEGLVRLIGIKPYYDGPLVGQDLATIYANLTQNEFRITAIYRHDHSVPLKDSTTIEAGDEVFFIAASENIQSIMNSLRRSDQPYRRVMIAGGGNIGYRLAQTLEKHYQVKIIDHNRKRAQNISEALESTVLLGNAQDRQLLLNENIENTDIFCAVTNDDEVNIMSALQAKRLGARKVIALSTRTAYVDLIQGGDIDIAISPQQITIGSILTYLRRGDFVNVHSLRRGAAEAIEIIAHGDKESSQVVGRTIGELTLPSAANISALVRNQSVLIADDEIRIEPEDHLIVFLTNKDCIKEIETLFQVNVSYF